jgi:hypothetical protein
VGLSKTEPTAVDDARVIQAVEQRDVRALQQTGEDAEVDLESSRESEHVLAPEKLCESRLELEVDVERPVEQTRTRAAGSEECKRYRGGFLDFRVIGEPEVVVRAQHDELFAIVGDDRVLSRRNRAVVGVYPRVANLCVVLRGISALLENVHSISSVEPRRRAM